MILISGNFVYAQDDHQRLSIEQQHVADQLRRLNSLLQQLEKTEREQGNIEIADTLSTVQEHMNNAEGVGDLVLALQRISQQLKQQRGASALSSQALIIEQLQLLLDMLLRSQEQMQAQREQELLEQRENSLKDLVSKQQNLLAELQKLKQQIKENQSNPKAETTEQLQQQLQRLQQQQQQAAEETRQFNREQQQQGIKSDSTERAEERQQQAAEELEQQQLEQAEESQQQAIEDLNAAQQEVQQQQSEQKQKALLNVEQEIKRILGIHRQQQQILIESSNSIDNQRLPRSSRIKIKEVAAVHEQLSIRADDLLLEIAQAGADSFPFFILSLMEDHQALADKLNLLEIDKFSQHIELSKHLESSWQELLDVIATERERERQQAEQPPSDQPSEDEDQQPLVQFASELQLLKRMHSSLSQRLASLKNQPSSDEFLKLIERQGELQLQYESMIRRLQGADDETKSEEIWFIVT